MAKLKKKLSLISYFWQAVSNICRMGCRVSFRIILTGMLGALLLLNQNSINGAAALSWYNWFSLVDETRLGTITAGRVDSYTPHRIKHQVKTTARLLGNVKLTTKYSISERIDGGSWSAPKEYWYHQTQKENVGEPINEEAIALSSGPNNHGIWYGTGTTGAVKDGGHENALYLTFVPNSERIDRLGRGSVVEVKIHVSLEIDDAGVHNGEHIITISNQVLFEWDANNSSRYQIDAQLDEDLPEVLYATAYVPKGSSTEVNVYERIDDETEATKLESKSITDFPNVDKPNHPRSSFWTHNNRLLPTDTESNFGTFYEPWNFQRDCSTADIWCAHYAFVLNKDVIYSGAGKKIELEIKFRRLGASTLYTISLTINTPPPGLIANWDDGIETNDDGNPVVLRDPNVSVYSDFIATLRVSKKYGDYFNANSIEYLNGGARIVGANSVQYPVDRLPPSFHRPDTRTYGRGWSNGSGRFRGGVWFFDGKNQLVAFQPMKDRLDELNAGDVIESHLSLYLIRGGGSSKRTLASLTITAMVRVSGVSLSISGVSRTVVESGAEYTIIANSQPPEDLTVNVMPTNTTGSFLDTSFGASGSTVEISNLKFSMVAGTSTYSAKLNVPLVSAPNTTEGVLTVSLIEDASTPPKYALGSNISHAVAILNECSSAAGNVCVSIEGNPAFASDRTMSGFKVTASHPPGQDLEVVVTGTTNSSDMACNATIRAGTTTATKVCAIHATSPDIMFTIQGGQNYIIGKPAVAYSHFVDATKPGITLTIEENSVDGGDDFTIKAEATHAPSDTNGLNVMVSFTDSGNRLDGTPSMTINIPKDGTEGELTVSTNTNGTGGVEDTISVSVEDNANYVVHPDVGTDSVTINADAVTQVPELTIAPKNVFSDAVTNGEFRCRFIVTASPASTTNLQVVYGYGNNSTVQQEFPANQATNEFIFTQNSSASECEVRLMQNPNNPSSYTIGSPNSATVFKTTSSGANSNLVNFSDDSLEKTVQESAGNVELVVTMTNALTNDVVVVYSLGLGGTATLGSDFEIPTYVIVISSGQTSQKITLPILADSVENEGSEYFDITLTTVTRDVRLGSKKTARVSIVENNAASNLVNFSDDSLEKTVQESDGNVELEVKMSNVLTADVIVVYSLGLGGTATLDSDFQIPAYVTTITKGQTSQKITLPILIDNEANEGSEYFDITLIQVFGNVDLGSKTTARVTISDSNLVNFTDNSLNKTVLETDGIVQLEINMSNALTASVTVNYTLKPGGTATLGSDFLVPTFATLINMGQTSQKITLVILTDSEANEGLEYFDIRLTQVSGSTRLGTKTTARVSIADSNVVNFSDDSLDKTVLESAGSVELEINMLLAMTTDTTVAYSLKQGGTATLDSDFQVPALATTIIKGQTSQKITLPILTDSDSNEGVEYFEISLTQVSGNVQLGSKTTARVSIADSNVVNFSDDSLDKTVLESEGSVEISVNLLQSMITDTTVAYTLEAGGTATFDTDFQIPAFTTTIAKGQTSQKVPLTILSDGQSESVEYFEISLVAVLSGEVQLGTKTKARVSIEDPAPISITSENIVINAGDAAEFSVSLHPPPQRNLSVPLVISQSSNSIVFYAPKQVNFRALQNTARFSISTIPDESNRGSINVRVGPYNNSTDEARVDVSPRLGLNGTKYSVAASVIRMILSEIPPTLPQEISNVTKPTLTISAVKMAVEEGESAVFTISTSLAVNSVIPVSIELDQSGDFVNGPMYRSVELEENTFETELFVKTDDDGLAELDGRITAVIQYGRGYIVGIENTAHVIVSDAKDRQSRKNSVTNALNAVLPDLLANSTARTFDIAEERVEQAFNGNPATLIELNGKSPAVTILQSGGEILNNNGDDWRSIFDDSSFAVALYPEGGQTSTATVWGFGDRWSLSGDRIGGQQPWDGETHTGHFGFDSRIGNGLLAGLAMSVSQSEVDIEQSGDLEMSFGSMTTAVLPFLGLSSLDGQSRMQVLVGYGMNELELKQKEYATETLYGNFHTVGLGGSNRFYSNGNFGALQNLELSVSGDAWHSQQFVNSVEDVVDSIQINASHFQMAIEATLDHYLGFGDSISPTVSIGMIGEVRNEESVFGLDIGSEVSYEAFNGFEVSGSAKSLLSELNRVRRWEIESSLNFDSGDDGKGVLFSKSLSWSGDATDANQYLWGNELLDVSNNSIASSNGRYIEAEIGYGFEVLGGSAVLTPYYALKQMESPVSEFQVGSRLQTNSGIDFELETDRSKTETGNSIHEYKLSGSITW